MSNLSEVLKQRRKELGYTLLQIAEAVGVSEATVQRWESGNIKTLRHENLVRLADILRVSPAYLMGWGGNDFLPDNIEPIGTLNKLPLVGAIACGTPILAQQNIVDYVDAPGHIHADYALICHGDSMINAGVRDGDVVYIRKQSIVDNGQIAAVTIDGDEATLKRFHYDGKTVILIPANDTLAPLTFSGPEINRVRVIGRAVAFLHMID